MDESQRNHSKKDWKEGDEVAVEVSRYFEFTDTCNQKIKEWKQEKEVRFFIFPFKSVEDAIAKKEDCIIQNI